MDDTKVCTNCRVNKPLSDFFNDANTRDKHSFQCKVCILAKQKAHYDQNKEGIASLRRKRYATDPKYRQMHMNNARRQYYKDYRATLEKKAELRERTKDSRKEYDRKRWLDRRGFIMAKKCESGCIVCGEKHPGCLDFHHRDASTKIFNIGEAVTPGTWRLEEVETEMKKCDVLCKNCHAKLHYEEKYGAGKVNQPSLPLG